MNHLPKARLENIVTQETATELLIYDLISNKALCLNETSKIIWQSCDGKTTFDELRHKQNLEFSDELIWLALNQLKADNLLDKSVEIEPKFNGLSRREVVRNIGFATMVALPMISSIVAPTAINAQSITGGCVTVFDCEFGDLSEDPNYLNCFDVGCVDGVCVRQNVQDGVFCYMGLPGLCETTICVAGACSAVTAPNGTECCQPQPGEFFTCNAGICSGQHYPGICDNTVG